MKTRIIWTTAILALIATAWGVAQDTPGLAGPLSAALLGTNSVGKSIGITLGTNLSLAGTTLNAAGGSSSVPALIWPLWGTFAGSSATNLVNPGPTEHYITTWAYTNAASVVNKYLLMDVTTGSGTGCTGGTCGYLAGFYSVDMLTAQCVITPATSGGSPNINTTGWKVMTWASGSMVSAGVCTLAAGGHIFVEATDSTALRILALDGTTSLSDAANAISSTLAHSYSGFATPFTTGNGGSLAFLSFSGISLSANSETFPVHYLGSPQ